MSIDRPRRARLLSAFLSSLVSGYSRCETTPVKYRRALAARPRGSPEPGDRVREGREAARGERDGGGAAGGGRGRIGGLAGEIRLSGTRFNELEGPRRDLAGHFSIGHGVDTTPLAEILCRWSQVGLPRGCRAGVRALV